MLELDESSLPLEIEVRDDSNIVFSNRVSTLKLLVKNVSSQTLKSIYLTIPKDYREKMQVLGRIGDIQVMWGGGCLKGCKILLPEDIDVLKPGQSAVAYFLLYAPLLTSKNVDLPLEVYSENKLVQKFNVNIKICYPDIRSHIYRARYRPKINLTLMNQVKEILEKYGIPSIEVYVWKSPPTPNVQIMFEGKEVAFIKGDIGSGFRHIFKIRMHRDVFIGEAKDPISGSSKWYWVVRLWFFWLDKSIFDEVPDAERIELWIDPEKRRVDWAITDSHWKEVVYKGPVEGVRARIIGTSQKFYEILKPRNFQKHLGKIIRSYHPPVIDNMETAQISPDSRDPEKKITTIYEVNDP